MTSYGDLVTRNEKIENSFAVLKEASSTTFNTPAFGYFADFSFEHYTIADENKYLKFEVLESLVLMQFCVKGAYALKNGKQKKSLSFECAKCNILFIPDGELHLINSSADLEFVNIYLNRSFFLKYIQMGFTPINSLVETFSAFFPKNTSITPKIRSVLNEITECQLDKHLKNLYLKAKIIELLTLQLVQYETEKATTSLLKPLEIEKPLVAKTLIDSNLNEAHSIAALARAAGTNEQYLKKHFKILFGTTVYGYLISCRMQTAKDMILSEKYKLTEIAATVGYKHPTHFTSAFKKFFGRLPQSFKAKAFFGGYLSLTTEFEPLRMLIFV